MMEPFAISMVFSTPLAGRAAPTLDAVLAAQLCVEQNRLDYPLDAIPLLRTEGVFHGSRLFVDAVEIRGRFTKYAHYEREWRDAPRLGLEPPAPGQARFDKNLQGGFSWQALRGGLFLGVGAVDEVRRIFSSVRALGVKRCEGFGRIREWEFERVEADAATFGLMDDAGTPVRPVPLETWRRIGGSPTAAIELCRHAPPYWSSENPEAVCASPIDNRIDGLWLPMLGLGEGRAAER